MRIFDAHCHIEKGMGKYDIPVTGKNIIFNNINTYTGFNHDKDINDTTSLVFDYKDNYEFVVKEAKNNRISAYKIHSRVQKITSADYGSLIEHLKSANIKIPVIIDSFFFGEDLEYQPDLRGIIQIAKAFPNIPIVIAHSGGYEITKFFYHLKNLENIFFELSFSIGYLKGTSHFMDFKNLIRFGNRRQIVFGTDYPFISSTTQLVTLNEMMAELKLSDNERDLILYSTGYNLFHSSNEINSIQ